LSEEPRIETLAVEAQHSAAPQHWHGRIAARPSGHGLRVYANQISYLLNGQIH
jgi:hypothetical protein